jgi:hypothetical protein
VAEKPSKGTPIAPPSATGNAGSRFEAKAGAFYLLAVLTAGEPRGLPGAVAQSVQFQGAADGWPLDDIIVRAVNGDGAPAILEIQAKRTIDFTASDAEFADVVRHAWAVANKPTFSSHRHEMAVAIARTSTAIERHCQEALHWARQHITGAAFDEHLRRPGFASEGMRHFVGAFRQHLATADAPTDADALWRLLRRFQILAFDFEAAGSTYENIARERARMALQPEQGGRASDLWSVLVEEASTRATAAGAVDRAALLSVLGEHGFRFETPRAFHSVRRKVDETTRLTLDDIKDEIGGFRLARADVVEECGKALGVNRLVEISCPPGVGKSAVLKHLVALQGTEGTVLLLSPGRISPGGWPKMAVDLGYDCSRDEFLNELACGGCATLFVDNLDQVDDPREQITLRDLLRGVVALDNWRVVVTTRLGSEEWKAPLIEEIRALGHSMVRVGEITDKEADILSAASPALAALLSDVHPARAMARNLFHLSRLLDIGVQDGGAGPVTETGLAKLWWRFGGARSEQGRSGRLKVLRELASGVMARPSAATYRIDGFDQSDVDALVVADTLREYHVGATAAFRHDVLRDWAIGFVLHEDPERFRALPLDRPLPGRLARGIEIAARLALDDDNTGALWRSLLTMMEADGVHGSWLRPVLLAVPRSENAVTLLDRLLPVLIENKGQRLSEIIRFVIAVESEPMARAVARANPGSSLVESIPASIVVPTSPAWGRVIQWLLTNIDSLPAALVPDIAKLFELWLIATREPAPINQLIVMQMYLWLIRLEGTSRPPARRGNTWPIIDVETEGRRALRENVRTTFLLFCHLQPPLAEQYLIDLRADGPHYHEILEILRFPNSLPKAAPTALVDFLIAALLPSDDPDQTYSRRRNHGPFHVTDTHFFPASPGQGPFFELLENAPTEGLRLIRAVVECATNWREDEYAEDAEALPRLTVPFPDGPRTFRGDFGIYQWSRGGTGPLVVASALMALEAWGHRQIEGGRRFDQVLRDVLGADTSSVAFVCVAIDLALSHWDLAKEHAWPFAASPRLVQFDDMRYTQDITGLGRFLSPAGEQKGWRVKVADLSVRSSRRICLANGIGDLALRGPPEARSALRGALVEAQRKAAQDSYPDDTDPIHGLKAIAERALRMSDAENWPRRVVQLRDGRKIEGNQYAPASDDIAAVAAAMEVATADSAETNIRLRVQRSLLEPATSTPEIVAEGIQWANPAPQRRERFRDEEFEGKWRDRTVIMAAALAGRDYEGEDRTEVETWSRSVLHEAAQTHCDDMATRMSSQIYANSAAIAAVGFAALYHRRADTETLAVLLRLATRDDVAIGEAIGRELGGFDHIDARIPRCFARLVLTSAVRPRRRDMGAADEQARETYRQSVSDAVNAELRWLAGAGSEPAWPGLPLWPSRRRRGIRLGPPLESDEAPEISRAPEDVYIDEIAVGNLVRHLARGVTHDWIVDLAQRLLAWTIEANNGPAEEGEDRDREHRPYQWNSEFFDFLGVVCARLPFTRSQGEFLAPITRLNEEAFYDAVGPFLNGFDRGTPVDSAGGASQPDAVRDLLVTDLMGRSRWRWRSDEKSFTTEMHLGHALHALFFHSPDMVGGPRAYLPTRCPRLPEFMPTLMRLVAGAPKSGYVAGLFLSLLETSPTASLLPFMVQATTAWSGGIGVDPDFWAEKLIGPRACAWIEQALDNDSREIINSPGLRQELMRSLDVMVRSGVTQARALETRITDDERRLTA